MVKLMHSPICDFHVGFTLSPVQILRKKRPFSFYTFVIKIQHNLYEIILFKKAFSWYIYIYINLILSQNIIIIRSYVIFMSLIENLSVTWNNEFYLFSDS